MKNIFLLTTFCLSVGLYQAQKYSDIYKPPKELEGKVFVPPIIEQYINSQKGDKKILAQHAYLERYKRDMETSKIFSTYNVGGRFGFKNYKELIAKLGKPSSVQKTKQYTYLIYTNTYDNEYSFNYTPAYSYTDSSGYTYHQQGSVSNIQKQTSSYTTTYVVDNDDDIVIDEVHGYINKQHLD